MGYNYLSSTNTRNNDMANEVDNSEDIIDSRDVIARIDELEADIESWEEDLGDHRIEIEDKESEIEELEDKSQELDDEKDAGEIAEIENAVDSLRSEIQELEDNIRVIENDIEEANEELKPIKSLADDAESYAPDWSYGAALIHDSYFEEYAKELVQDIGDLPQDIPSYIENNIDWEGVASDIQIDYASVDFDGVEYWIR